jgi:hypothetical protein
MTDKEEQGEEKNDCSHNAYDSVFEVCNDCGWSPRTNEVHHGFEGEEL